jgi:hypothetical protein
MSTPCTLIHISKMVQSNRHNDIANYISTNYDRFTKMRLKKIRKHVARDMTLTRLPQKAFTKYVLHHLRQDKSCDFSHVKNS